MAMVIERVLNNNAAVVLSDKGDETVVMGKGIAFRKSSGDFIDAERKVEKVFTLSENDANSRFQKLVAEVPIEHIIISEQIITHAMSCLGKKLNDNIYITLTDHINSAIQRYKDAIVLKNALLWDIRQFYPDEFSIGLEAIEMVKSKLGVEFIEDEAAFMALHFVNARMETDMTLVHDMTKLIQEISNIVKYHLRIEFDNQSLSYYRFISHLKFFAQRLFKQTFYDDDDDTIFNMVRKKHPREFQCTQVVAKFVRQHYGYQMHNEEMTYVTVHIARLVKESKDI